jgi:divinyl protochlorophyllide a 8-vinyl-reductase
MRPRPDHHGRIGPNAVTRLAESLTLRLGDGPCHAVFAEAGLVDHLFHPPEDMVDDEDVARLHAALVSRLGEAQAAEIAADAGRRTADYLLAVRIPHLAQRLLAMLPRRLAANLLIRAVARHAWTFAGSGRFAWRLDHGLGLELAGSPTARHLHTSRPACRYFAATFQRVFAAMLGPQVRVTETECEACGADACRFALSWR